MRIGALALLGTVPATAAAQTVAAASPRDVVIASAPFTPPVPASRFGVAFALGPGFARAGFSSTGVDVGVQGAVSMLSARASFRVHPWVAAQLGVAGAVTLAPSTTTSTPGQRVGLEKASGFGLVGGGVVIGRRREGVRVSLLAGVAWLWAAIDGSVGARAGAGPGGGAFVEVSRDWAVGDAWLLGLGVTAWGLAGRDADWLGASTSWNVFGGALVATVSTR